MKYFSVDYNSTVRLCNEISSLSTSPSASQVANCSGTLLALFSWDHFPYSVTRYPHWSSGRAEGIFCTLSVCISNNQQPFHALLIGSQYLQ